MELIHSIDGIVWEADARTFQFVFVSRQAERLLGYPIEQWLDEPDFWRDHIHPDDRDAAVAACVDATAKNQPHEFEYRMIALDGHEVWLRDIVTIHAQDGQPSMLRGVMIDITQSRVQARALDRMNRLYGALSRIGEVALLAVAEAELFARFCECLVEFGGLKMAWIGWNDPATCTVKVAGQFGDTQGYLREIKVRSDNTPEGRGPVGIAIREDRSCVLNEFLTAPGTLPWRKSARRHGFRSVGAFPIHAGGRVCGALAGYANDTDFFGAREIELLERAAGHLSFALDHQKGEASRRQVEVALRESESRFRRMFEHTADALMIMDCATRRFTDCNRAALEMLGCTDKADVLSLTPADISPPCQPEGRRSAEQAEEMVSRALRDGSHRFEWVLRGPHRADFFAEVLLTPILMEEQQLIIVTLRDISQRKRAERTQAALHQISEAAHSSGTLSELFIRIHHIVGELLPARNFFVALHDERNDELTFPYFVDEIDPTPGPMKIYDGTLSGEVIHTGRSLLLTPEGQRERIAKGKVAVGADSVDWLGVPLKSRERTIGALVVQSYTGDIRYTQSDRDLLEFVSVQVATAIVRKQAEEALRDSEARFRLLFEQNQAGVYRTRTDGQLVECNEAFALLLGYASRDEIMRANSRSFYFEGQERDMFLARLNALGSMANEVVRLRRKDGREVWGMESVTLIRDEHGQPDVIQGTVIDFTDRKRVEEELRLSESRLEQAQRLAHLGSWNWDLASRTLNWSDELCRIYGVDPSTHVASFEDFLGRVHPDDRVAVEASVSKALVDFEPVNQELRILRPDGDVRTLFDQAEVLVDAHGNPMIMAGACLDITSRKLEEMFERDRSSILGQVAQGMSLPDIFSSIATMLEAQIPLSRCAVFLLKEGRMHTMSAPRLPAAYSRALDGVLIGPSVGSCGAACHSGRTVISEDIATDPLWEGHRESALLHGLRACWSMPIPSRAGGALGSLAVYRHEPSRPDRRELDFMRTATQLASVAIEHRMLTEQLEHQAHHDSLTGLPNRLLFLDRLRQALASAERREQKVAVLYMDLDRFKNINDTLGHSAGDALLQQAADRLSTCIRKSDTLARLGGDEFIVVVAELTDSQDAMRVASGLIEVLRLPFLIDGHETFVSVSLGISIYPTDGTDVEDLIANADAAMYRAKDKGRDNFQWFAPEMNVLARERMELEGHLRHALELGQLSLHYQPQCSPSGDIQGFEALMRWHHPVLGPISPARFIPLAEDSGLIVQMGEWALREACVQMAAWHRDHPTLRMAVNVSAVQFKRPDWVETVVRALRDSGLAPSALELEITESLILQSLTDTSANLFGLRELGVGVAIDDFGTGYSSLSYLHKLPVTTLKIDQSFVSDIGLAPTSDQESAPVIRTIIALARNFGLGTVAEGVETEAQRELLVRLGCDSLQGYLLHRPMTAVQAESLLRSKSAAVLT